MIFIPMKTGINTLYGILTKRYDDIITATYCTSQCYDCDKVICSSKRARPTASWSVFDGTRGVHVNGNSHSHGIFMGFPWEWE